MTSVRSEQGSVLFLILIAVILFAALSYTVSSMMRGGAKLGNEKAGIYVSEVLSYAQSMNEAVHSLRISNGCEEGDISFERSPFDGSDTNYINASSPTDFSCHIFHPNGGGVSQREMQTEIFDSAYSGSADYGNWIISGASKVLGLGSDSNGELILTLPYLKSSVCEILAKRIGQPLPIPSDSGGVNLAEFIGTYPAPSIYDNVDDRVSGCLNVTGGGSPPHYMFFSILLAR